MHYISTRGVAPALGFVDVVMKGLADDGGLYVPALWPQLSEDDLINMRGLPYTEVAVRVMAPFVSPDISEGDLRVLVEKAYGGFTHQAIAPLSQLDSNLWLMELYHGPTLAFKDVALQLLGQLFDYILKRKNQRLTVLGATSGDTGSAAIHACKGLEQVRVFILHPEGRTSDVQRRQMTTVAAPNVFNIAVEGTFDDCQEMVKGLFNDERLRNSLNLTSVNSINWARLMAQIVYYVYAAVNLGAPQRAVSFAVPTGNFGNIFAAYAAQKMGVPIAKLVCASNANDILTRFGESGTMALGAVHPSLSPSMDIQISSNFERLLFDLTGRNAGEVIRQLAQFRYKGSYEVTSAQHRHFLTHFVCHRASDEATLETIAAIYRTTGCLVDPHTAVGLTGALAHHADKTMPMVSLACAHPAKFPEAVEAATGVRPDLPPALAALLEGPERYITLRKDLAELARYIRSAGQN